MASALEPFSRRDLSPATRQLDRRTASRLEAIDRVTVLREAQVQSDGIVSQAKVRELGHTTREGLTDVAMIHAYAVTVANGDPMLFDRLNGLVNLLTMTVGEVLADLNDTYCREARR